MRFEREASTPIPIASIATGRSPSVRAAFPHLAAGEETDAHVSVAGRLYLIRRHGGLVFADLHDQTGKIQLVVSNGTLSIDEAFAGFGDLDIGDWVGVEGTVMVTKDRRGVGQGHSRGAAVEGAPAAAEQGARDQRHRGRGCASATST